MNLAPELSDYLREVRAEVCSHCDERPPEGPPCGPLGKRCGIESHLGRLVQEVHSIRSSRIDPYLDELHHRTCTVCAWREDPDCPCPLEYLHVLAVQAIEEVDRRACGDKLTH